MEKYLICGNGQVVTSEELKDIYRVCSFVTFNERDYGNWLSRKIASGFIKVMAEMD